MDIFRELDLLIGAKYPLIYVVTWEEDRVMKEIRKIADKNVRDLYSWTPSTKVFTGAKGAKKEIDALGALDEFVKSQDQVILVLYDFHSSLTESHREIIRRMREVVAALRTSLFKTVLIVSPVLRIPPELEKDMTVIDCPLPEVKELETVLDRIIRENENDPTVKIRIAGASAREKILKAALGLTLNETERVINKAIASRKFSEEDIGLILNEKKQIIRKSGVLEYFAANEAFKDIGGLDQLKDWLKKRGEAFTEEARQFGLPEPRGIMLIGVPGCGKSLCAKAIAAEWDKPLLRLELGSLFSANLGSSEENIRKATRIAESISPAILWIDEIEKGFSGTGSGGDNGTTGRVFATFVTWMQEKTKPVFVVATANDISRLPPELVRKGRFDEIFFVDLPDLRERERIFEIHLTKLMTDKRFQEQLKLGLRLAEMAERTEHFSGAEIEQVVIAALFDAFLVRKKDREAPIAPLLLQNINVTTPLALTMGTSISGLRQWAQTRAVPASSQRLVQAAVAQAPVRAFNLKPRTPFAFDDTYVARTLDEFLMAGRTRKSEVSRDLYNQRLEQWLRDNGFEPVAREAIRIREGSTNLDIGVDTFLEAIEEFLRGNADGSKYTESSQVKFARSN